MRTSCRFAMSVHLMAVLAHHPGGRVTSSRLAGSVNTNPVTIRLLLLALQKARLVETRKGAGRGSRLRREPSQIPLSDIYRAVEGGEPFVFPAKQPNPGCPVGSCVQRELKDVFARAEAALERELGRTTLEDVVRRVAERCGETGWTGA